MGFLQHWRAIAFSVIVIFAYLAGYWIASDHYEKLSAKKEQRLLTIQLEQEKTYNEKIKTVTDDLVKKLNDSNAIAIERGATLERVRNENARLQRRIKANSASAESEALGKCSNLLEESSKLLAEGAGFLLRDATEHDALIDLIAEKPASNLEKKPAANLP